MMADVLIIVSLDWTARIDRLGSVGRYQGQRASPSAGGRQVLIGSRISLQALGYEVDFKGADALSTSLVSDGTPDPDIGKLKKPRLVSKVNLDADHTINLELTPL